MPARKNPPTGAPQLKPYHFKKGQSGNPEGSRAHNPITKALKNLTVETYREVIDVVLTGNVANLQKMITDEKTSALQVGVATAFLKAIKNGDYDVVERIAQRIVGKIPDELNINSTNRNANLNASIDPTKLRAALEKLENDL